MYHYAALGPERFQEFCQALLIANFPNAQCLPVGQPDGGRDAFFNVLSHTPRRSRKRELVVFQVKFVRAASEDRDGREFIKSMISSEAEKVRALKDAGLKRYYLLTNVGGTAHPESGSIDIVNKQLSEAFEIEAYCWWREDLDRHLDINSSIKWSYPEILKATDLLEALLTGAIGEDGPRRRSAIRAYMTTQYDDDEELKFKQVELRSTIATLFVDLPMTTAPRDRESSATDGMTNSEKRATFQNPAYRNLYPPIANTAEFFLLNSQTTGLSRIVLEGAPGQGKSTITQYLCQVMRMRLLEKRADLSEIPDTLRNSPLRIPFRVDFRDLAKWIAGIDPFHAGASLNPDEPRSLEGFLSAQVRIVSGGHDFNVSDLFAISRESHIFIALDGFDEVADVETRGQLVLDVSRGIARLQSAGAFSVQAIVTSRPAAFSKSVQFPRDSWSYFSLVPLERKQVDAYTVKWMKAKGIKASDRSSFLKLLDSKLKEPHTQYLSRNPMQLTILLTLIYSRGASLPEKRTSMYDSYMDLFFSRESEKSDIVRDYRDLLIDIHRFIAWKLQTSAENGGDGSIKYSDLRSMLLLYLDQQGEATAIVGALFDGVVQRVGALVSRVQDTYEFEVQPLREYFAARHLYETAPYAPAGEERAGTKLERFDALARNPYWLNVTRFFAGCFSKGEVSALVDQLNEIAECDLYRNTTYAKALSLTLLGDWVFTQFQPAVKRIAHLICEYPQLRQLVASAQFRRGTSFGELPERCGKNEVITRAFEHLLSSEHDDETRGLADLVRSNLNAAELFSLWKSSRSSIDDGHWVRIGARLGIFRIIDKISFSELFPNLNMQIIDHMIHAQRFDILTDISRSDSSIFSIILSKLRPVFMISEEDSLIAKLYSICSFFPYHVAVSEDYSFSLRQALEYRLGPRAGAEMMKRHKSSLGSLPHEGPQQRAIQAYETFLDFPTAELSTSRAPWVNLVEALRHGFGDQLAFDRMAVVAAGVREGGVDDAAYEDMASTSNLVETVRYMRLKSGAPKWWKGQLSGDQTPLLLRRKLLVLWAWGTVRTIIALADTIDAYLSKLSSDDWQELFREFDAVDFAIANRDDPRHLTDVEFRKLNEKSVRFRTFAAARLQKDDKYRIAIGMADYLRKEQKVEGSFAISIIFSSLRQDVVKEPILRHLRSLYALGFDVKINEPDATFLLSDAQARAVANDPASYPLRLLAEADSIITAQAGEASPKLLDIAEKEKWFS